MDLATVVSSKTRPLSVFDLLGSAACLRSTDKKPYPIDTTLVVLFEITVSHPKLGYQLYVGFEHLPFLHGSLGWIGKGSNDYFYSG